MKLLARSLTFFVFSVCLAWSSVGAVEQLLSLARRDDTASHIVLVPFVTLALLYERRRSVFDVAHWDPLPGTAVILIGMTLAVAGGMWRIGNGSGGSLSMMVLGMLMTWIGGGIFCYGRNAFRVALFPVLFLAFAIPIPSVLLAGATHFLKAGSADAVSAIFTLTRTPYYRDGFVFSLPKFVIEIADECSGIRSSIALLLTSLLAGDRFLGSKLHRLVLVATVLPIAILKNGIRIASLSLLASYVDPGFLVGQLHHEGGIVFFLLVLPVLALVIAILRQFDGTASHATAPA